jgi:hypothetical protein
MSTNITLNTETTAANTNGNTDNGVETNNVQLNANNNTLSVPLTEEERQKLRRDRFQLNANSVLTDSNKVNILG